MEPMLQGLRRLIDFALSSPYHSPPRILFASSIGVVKSTVYFFHVNRSLTSNVRRLD